MLGRVDPYSLQPARLADAGHLAAMSQEFIEAGLRPSWPASRITWHIHNPDSIVLTARFHEVVAAFAIMRYGDETAHLNLLAVDPAHRRLGVGRRMMTWLEQTAVIAGTFTIGLELRASNEAAFAFYASLGYRESRRVSGYYQGIEHAIRMTRDLRSDATQFPA